MKLVEKQIVALDEMAGIISLLKTFKEIKIGEKLGFFHSLATGYTELTWDMIIKEILAKYLTI
jgi:hypothetical protein